MSLPSGVHNECEEFIERAVQSVPALRPALSEHLADQGGKLLPHVFMGDVTRFIIRESERADSQGLAAKLLQQFETELGSGWPSVQDLIWVSFVENLGDREYGLLKPMLGPRLMQACGKINEKN